MGLGIVAGLGPHPIFEVLGALFPIAGAVLVFSGGRSFPENHRVMARLALALFALGLILPLLLVLGRSLPPSFHLYASEAFYLILVQVVLQACAYLLIAWGLQDRLGGLLLATALGLALAFMLLFVLMVVYRGEAGIVLVALPGLALYVASLLLYVAVMVRTAFQLNRFLPSPR